MRIITGFLRRIRGQDLTEARRRNRDAARDLDAVLASVQRNAVAGSDRPGWARLASG